MNLNLKIYDTTNSKVRSGGKATIHISPKGAISLSGGAVKRMDLKILSRIEIAQDQNRPTDWYIRSSSERHAFPLRQNKGSKSRIFNNSYLAKKILESVGLNESFSFPIGGMQDGWYVIITAAAKKAK